MMPTFCASDRSSHHRGIDYRTRDKGASRDPKGRTRKLYRKAAIAATSLSKLLLGSRFFGSGCGRLGGRLARLAHSGEEIDRARRRVTGFGVLALATLVLVLANPLVPARHRVG